MDSDDERANVAVAAVVAAAEEEEEEKGAALCTALPFRHCRYCYHHQHRYCPSPLTRSRLAAALDSLVSCFRLRSILYFSLCISLFLFLLPAILSLSCLGRFPLWFLTGASLPLLTSAEVSICLSVYLSTCLPVYLSLSLSLV